MAFGVGFEVWSGLIDSFWMGMGFFSSFFFWFCLSSAIFFFLKIGMIGHVYENRNGFANQMLL